MSNVSIAWNESSPANTDLVGQGDDEIRSLKSNLRGGLAAEHDWPTSGPANAGGHKLGSARVFVGTNSQVSSADTSGRLMWDSSNSNLNYVGAEGTGFIGGAYGVSFSTILPPLSAASRFMVSCVSVTQATWPTGPISMGLPPSHAGLRPFYFVSICTHAPGSALTGVTAWVDDQITNGPKVYLYNPDGSASTDTWTVNVMAVGFGPI